ncbi:MAG: TetR/AcrR family transcriptional regulator [Syntrophobacteraceae bacterium]
MDKKSTKTKILKTGAELVYHQGFNNTGIQQILAASGVPKGSFYFYFKSKDEFGLELIQYFDEELFALRKEIFADSAKTPLNRFRAYFQWCLRFYGANNFRGGCPIGNLALELSDLNPIFQKQLASVAEKMIDHFGEVLQQARDLREIPADVNIRETSRLIFSCWEGALLHMKIEKTLEPLYLAARHIFAKLLQTEF